MGTELCKIAYKYGTDKCPRLRHFYTPFYFELFKDRRESIKKVLEMGVGCCKTMPHVEVYYDKKLKRYYHRGASLLMWRDFFPNAQVYGADIRPDAMFEDKRIKTFLCDETKEKDLINLIKKTGTDIDFFIDDGVHRSEWQISMCRTLMPLLKKDVTYIIEDVIFNVTIARALPEYDCYTPDIPRSRKHRNSKLVVVRNKNL